MTHATVPRSCDDRFTASHTAAYNSYPLDIEQFREATEPFTSGEGDRSDNLDQMAEVLDGLEADLEGSDRAPTGPQKQVLVATVARLDHAEVGWNGIRSTQLPQLNARLQAAGLEEIAIPPVERITLGAPSPSADRP